VALEGLFFKILYITAMSKKLTIGKSQFLIYQNENGITKLDVRFDNSDVWLTQEQLASLFEIEKPGVIQHIKNIFVEGELEENSVSKKFLRTASDGKNYEVNRLLTENSNQRIWLKNTVLPKNITKPQKTLDKTNFFFYIYSQMPHLTLTRPSPSPAPQALRCVLFGSQIKPSCGGSEARFILGSKNRPQAEFCDSRGVFASTNSILITPPPQH
jgi:hypothetical protein